MNETIVRGKDRCSYASPRIEMIEVLAEQAVIMYSSNKAGFPGENDPIINDWGTI
ncbi:MAG: hypothetical protein MSA53_02315 [Bacteroidales bacterium]|nr:hypothetical protein [Bacteroidales bacterium]MDY5356330.1 hypothetical protein [Candidatus Cryptobacteroides sp.]